MSVPMPEPLRIMKRKFLVSLAEGDPVPTVLYEAARTKRPAKATEEWKPCPCRCSMCGKGKMFRSQKCPHCVQHKQWSDATFEWRPKKKRPHTIILFCHCGQKVDNCRCEDEKSPKDFILYDDDECPNSGIPVKVMEPGCKTYAEILFEAKYELENLQAHYYPYCQDGDNLPLDARFEMEEGVASGGAAGGAADSAAKSAEKASDVINLVSSDDEKEAGMSP